MATMTVTQPQAPPAPGSSSPSHASVSFPAPAPAQPAYHSGPPFPVPSSTTGPHLSPGSYPNSPAGNQSNFPTPEKHETTPFLNTVPAVNEKTWIPMPFRPYFYIPFIVVVLTGAIGLEILLFFSKKDEGWDAGQTQKQQTALNFAYSIPPVVIASIFVAMWRWTDVEIKKLQPYVDLLHGDASPEHSVLLDYTRSSNVVTLARATFNKHFVVAAATGLALLTLTFQPLASALLVVKDVWWEEPLVTSKIQSAVGLGFELQSSDLTAFLAASGFAGASVMYRVEAPAFVKPPYAIAPFELPLGIATNGTAIANTTAVKVEPGCVQLPVTTRSQIGGWENTVSYNGCTFSWSTEDSTRVTFGTGSPSCSSSQPPQFGPVIFWFFSYEPTAIASAAFCQPTLSIWDVTASVDVVTGNVTKVVELRPFDSYSRFSSLSANVTGAPLNGRPYNGLVFDIQDEDAVLIARENATRLQLPASVFWAAERNGLGLDATFRQNQFWTLTNTVYGMYLATVAVDSYFVPHEEPIEVRVVTFRKRVFVSEITAHLLAAALLILGICSIAIHFVHRSDRETLNLKHEPGTIASAVSLGAQTGLGHVLAYRQGATEMKDALRDRKFRMDPNTNKIVMEGEPLYDAIPPVSELKKRHTIASRMSKIVGGNLSNISLGSTANAPR